MDQAYIDLVFPKLPVGGKYKTMDATKGHLTPLAWKPVASEKTWGPIQFGDGLY